MPDAEVDRYGRVRDQDVSRYHGVRDNSWGRITPKDIGDFNEAQARERRRRQSEQGSPVIQALIEEILNA